MNCRDVERELHPYMDGEFELEEALKLEAHLDQCAGCRQTLVFERKFQETFRDKLDCNRTPRRTRDAIMRSIAMESRGPWSRILERAGLDSPGARLQFAGAFSLAFVAVLSAGQWNAGSGITSSQFRDDGRAATASVPVQISNQGMTLDDSLQGPNPVLSMVSGDLTRSAIGAHFHEDQFDSGESRETTWTRKFNDFRNLEPPIQEGSGRRLVGARIGGRGLVSSVVYEYDVAGTRVTAVQSVLPRGWGSLGRFYHQEKRDGLTVVTFQQSEGILTSLVSTLDGPTLQDFAEESIVP